MKYRKIPVVIDRIEKDFSKLDFNTVDFESANWTWSLGGHPLSDLEYSVSYIDEDMVQTRYKLPEFMNEMIRRMQKHAREETQTTIRRAIGF